MTAPISYMSDDFTSSSLFSWTDLLELGPDDQFGSDHRQRPVLPASDESAPEPGDTDDTGRVRKRDPRMVCSNFLAGRVPCACPELDEKKVEEELAGHGSGKKRVRFSKTSAAGLSAVRCQVPCCEVDIGELKGYHRRHRVCLRCANATAVELGGESKRYCQQCGKFHVLSDFDEGKRSCRRKLERHNNRRRRKSTDSRGSAESKPQQVTVADGIGFDEDFSKAIINWPRRKSTNSKAFFEKKPQHVIVADEVGFDKDFSRDIINSPRRKSTNSKGSFRKEPQQVVGFDEVGVDEEFRNDGTYMSSQIAEREALLGSEGNLSTLCSSHASQFIQSDSVASFAASGEICINRENKNLKYIHSLSYGDNRNAFSSVCPTGRISFKLYDWNPAEFPRRLRHQIFQWLASMPVELEGYIRPGCTILTAFIAMPQFKWAKLLEDPAKQLNDLVLLPGNLLFGRGSFLVYLNDMVFQVSNGGTSISKVKLIEKTPALFYAHPTCFEAGKPMEFFVCGSNLLQSKFQFLVSFYGKYLVNDFHVLSSCCEIQGDPSSVHHQLLKINVPPTKADIFGPAFIEVENESGLSNFIPILIADKEICADMKKMPEKFSNSLRHSREQSVLSCPFCELSMLGDAELMEFMLDVAWLIREPALENIPLLSSSLIQRFNSLLYFLLENELTSILERVVDHMKVVMDKSSVASIAKTEMEIFWHTFKTARGFLSQRLMEREFSIGTSRKVMPGVNCSSHVFSKIQLITSVIDQDLEVNNKCKLESRLVSPDDSPRIPLLNGEAIMSLNLTEQLGKSCSPLLRKTVVSRSPLVLVITAVTVCFGVCAVILNPGKVGEFTTTYRESV